MTNIPYHVATAGLVKLEILNLSNKIIATLMNDELKPGEYKAEFYVSHHPQGTYLCRLTVNGTTDVRKIVLVK